jgi:cytochrome c-type biogenesis protein CcmF
VLSLGTAALGALGAHRRSERLVEGAVQGTYASFGLAAFASSLIIYAFLSGDYSIQYVQHTSDAAMPLFYKITAFWGGLDGSLLFWVLLHTLFGSLAVRANRQRHRELIPHVVAVLATITCFLSACCSYQGPVLAVFARRADAGQGPQPAAAEPVHDHPPAEPVPRLRLARGALRVRHGGPVHRQVDARGSAACGAGCCSRGCS